MPIQSHSFLDLVGHMSYLMIAIGMWRLGKGSADGFLIQAVGAFVWLVAGFYLALSSVVVWNSLFVILAIFGYLQLQRKNDGSS